METTALEMFNRTVQYEHNNIWIKPVCEFFNLNVQNQQRKLKNDPILENLWTKSSTDLGEIDKNGRILLSRKGFLRWVQIINANTIDAAMRTKFILYQSLIFDFLYGNFEREEQMRIEYTRLKRLRSLYGKIGREIQRVENSVKGYLDSRFTQLSLDFKQPKQLKSA